MTCCGNKRTALHNVMPANVAMNTAAMPIALPARTSPDCRLYGPTPSRL